MSLRGKTVDCPVCSSPVLERDINAHLDSQCTKHVFNGPASTKGAPGPSSKGKGLAPIFSAQPKGKRRAPPTDSVDEVGEIEISESDASPTKAKPPPSKIAALHLGPPTKKAKTTTANLRAAAPLAEKMRPASLDDVVGHEHITGPDSLLRTLVSSGGAGSMILWGPAGCGKTTLARLLAKESGSRLVELSATSSGSNDVRGAFEEAKNTLKLTGVRTILFMDEIHRFNKAQQDLFLPYVEQGLVQLVGATTENPSFRINNALLSRCRVFVLERLTDDNIKEILNRTLRKLSTSSVQARNTITTAVDPSVSFEPPSSSPPMPGPSSSYPQITEKILNSIVSYSLGDARTALSLLELAIAAAAHTDESVLLSSLKKSVIARYDRGGDDHYDMISALHKSVRGGDGSAAMYWLARMLTAGEDPLYVARRCIVMASEDIGLANDRALPLAIATYNACTIIGMPECRINLAHLVAYLAESPKSTRSYEAYNKAEEAAKADPTLPVPMNIRNAPTRLMKELDYGRGYLYNPDFAHPVHQDFLPKQLANAKFLRKEGDMEGKEWDEDLLRQWEVTENNGGPWDGRPSSDSMAED